MPKRQFGGTKPTSFFLYLNSLLPGRSKMLASSAYLACYADVIKDSKLSLRGTNHCLSWHAPTTTKPGKHKVISRFIVLAASRHNPPPSYTHRLCFSLRSACNCSRRDLISRKIYFVYKILKIFQITHKSHVMNSGLDGGLNKAGMQDSI